MIIDKLLKMESNLYYSVPFVPTIHKIRDYNLNLNNVRLDDSNIKLI